MTGTYPADCVRSCRQLNLRETLLPYTQVSFLFSIVVVVIWALGSAAQNPIPETTPIMLVIAIPIGLVVGTPTGLAMGTVVGLGRVLTRRAQPAWSAFVLGVVGATLCLGAFEIWFMITPTYRSALQESSSVALYGILMFVTRLFESRLR